MGASDLPLDIRQRIESRWSAQIKRHQQQQQLDLEARAASSSPGDDPDDCGLVAIADWEKQRPSDP
jgi:hypothetical protein